APVINTCVTSSPPSPHRHGHLRVLDHRNYLIEYYPYDVLLLLDTERRIKGQGDCTTAPVEAHRKASLGVAIFLRVIAQGGYGTIIHCAADLEFRQDHQRIIAYFWRDVHHEQVSRVLTSRNLHGHADEIAA